MKSRLFLFTAWLNADPRRVRLIAGGLGLAVAVVALLSPEAALATPIATGGS